MKILLNHSCISWATIAFVHSCGLLGHLNLSQLTELFLRSLPSSDDLSRAQMLLWGWETEPIRRPCLLRELMKERVPVGFVSFDSPPGWRESLASSHNGTLVSGLDGHLLNYYNYYFELVIYLLGSKSKIIQKIYSEKSHSFPCSHSSTSPPPTNSHTGNHCHFCFLCILTEFFILIKKMYSLFTPPFL